MKFEFELTDEEFFILTDALLTYREQIMKKYHEKSKAKLEIVNGENPDLNLIKQIMKQQQPLLNQLKLISEVECKIVGEPEIA